MNSKPCNRFNTTSGLVTIAGKNVLNNLQGLRGIAALMVCFYHISAVLPEGFVRDFLKQGIIGVQVFFMISGFIMVHTTRTLSDKSVTGSIQFLLRRLIRIAPLYYIATFIYIADDINDGYFQANTVKLLKSLAFIPQMTAENGPYYGVPPLEVGWSLNYEMLFYVLLAISLLFGRLKYILVAGLLSIVVFVAPLLAGSHFTFDYSIYHHFNTEYLNFAANPIMIHFIFGMVAAHFIPFIKLSKLAAQLMLVVSSILFLVYYSGLYGLEINALNDLIFCGLLFSFLLINDYHSGGIKLNQLLVKIGDSSYSLYLFHVIILVYMKMLFHKLNLGGTINTYGFFLFISVTCIAVSHLIYIYLEKKIHINLMSLFFRKPQKSR